MVVSVEILLAGKRKMVEIQLIHWYRNVRIKFINLHQYKSLDLFVFADLRILTEGAAQRTS